jgi:hypothetical protein
MSQKDADQKMGKAGSTENVSNHQDATQKDMENVIEEQVFNYN